MARGNPRPIGELLTELMARRGFARQQGAAACESAWREAAGEVVARQSRIGAIRRGVLDVMVSSSSISQEITMRRAALLGRLRELMPDQPLSDLRIRVGRID